MEGAAARPPVVYLDTQDYSRFGDVLRGRSDAATERLFHELERRVRSAEVIFAISMPLLGELLHYHPEFRETTLRKAEAVERLCGPYALPSPARLIAMEVAQAAMNEGLVARRELPCVLSCDRYWYPNIGDIFAGLRDQLLYTAQADISASGLNRNQRRLLKKKLAKADLAELARKAVPEMSETYGLPQAAIENSIVQLLKGRISAEQASRALFEYVAEPRRFVEVYFERIETDRDLPEWISGFGKKLATAFDQARANFQPFVEDERTRGLVFKHIEAIRPKIEQAMLKLDEYDAAEFGIETGITEMFRHIPEFRSSLPSARVLGGIVPAYLAQVLGLYGSPASIETSFAGDSVHALYLPHVDLWRADRRFGALAKEALPELSGRVVTRLADLPAAIDQLRSQSAPAASKR